MADASGLRTVVEMVADVAAPAPLVWGVLTRFSAYPEWNPFLLSVEGRLRRGAELVARVAPPQQPPITIHLLLRRVCPPRELCWRGHMLAPGLLEGEQAIEVIPIETGRCRLRHVEHLSGVLMPLLAGGLQQAARAGMEAMVHALKLRAERLAAE